MEATMNIVTQAMQEVLLGFKPKPDLLENLTPPIPATQKHTYQELVEMQKKDPIAFKNYIENSGTTTAHLKAGQDTIAVVDKMLLEKGFVDWEAVPADDFVLQVDLDMDREAALKHMEPIIPLLCRRIPLGLKWATYKSKSGKHTHAVFTMPEPMELYERMAWQAVLGSDRMREALNLIGLHNGVLNQVVLFMPRDKSGITFEDLTFEVPVRRVKDVE